MLTPTPTQLRLRRRSKHMTQNALAKKIGISGAHLCNLELRNATASTDLRNRWQSALGFPTSTTTSPTMTTKQTKKGVRITILVNAH